MKTKRLMMIMMMASGVFQQANAYNLESVLAVSDCKPYQRVQAKIFGLMNTYSYTNFRFATKVCDYNYDKGKFEVKVVNQVVDLGLFEDNDNREVTNNLKGRCEALREEALGALVSRNETACRGISK